MDIKPFKKAQNDEMELRTSYQQQLFQQQKELLTSSATAQPFHPLQQQSFYFNEIEKALPEKKIVRQETKFDMDMIDDVEDDTQQSITQKPVNMPFVQNRTVNQPIVQNRIVNQPIVQNRTVNQPIVQNRAVNIPQMDKPTTYRKSEASNPQPFRNLQPEQLQPSPQPFQPLGQSIQSIRPQSFPLVQPMVSNPDHQLVYQSFEIYFNNPTFVKTNEPNESFSLYYARVNCMLAEFRYLIIVLDQDQAPKGTEVPLHNLRWKSFQLRTLAKEVPAPEMTYKKENNGVFDDEIKLIKRDKTANKVMYQCRFNPLIVELLPSKKGSVMDYPDSSTLETAMDTFQCVIYFS